MEEFKSPVHLTDEQLRKYVSEIEASQNEVLRRLSKPEIYGNRQIAHYLYFLENRDVLVEPPELPYQQGLGAVLRKSDLEYLCNKPKLPLIEPVDLSCMKESASYQLRLGSRYRVRDSQGKDVVGWLTSSKPVLTIAPHGIAMVSTLEWLNIPGFLIGRWNLKVKMVYTGLVWVGSLQVDPGYQGFLFCPLYNLSDKPQELVYNRPLFIIDFVLTTPAKDKYQCWAIPEGNKYSTFDFDRLDEQKIHSAPEHDFEIIRKDFREFKDDVVKKTEKLDERVQKFQEWVMIAFAVIVAVIAVIATFGAGSIDWSKIDPVGTTLVGVAIGLSILSIVLVLWKTRKPK